MCGKECIMANISAIITQTDTPSTGWYKAKISTNASIEVSAVSLFATKMNVGQVVGVIQYRNWSQAPEFGFVELNAKQSIVYVAPQNTGAVTNQNPNNTALAMIANLVGNIKMLYHPATVTKVNTSTLNVSDRVTGQSLTLNVSNVKAQDFEAGNGCLIELSSNRVIGFWLCVPDYVLPDPGTGKSAQVGYSIERNFVILPAPFQVKFGSYISYKELSGYYVWKAINETIYNVPSDPAGTGDYPSITMMSPISKYIYPNMMNGAQSYTYRRRYNRHTRLFEDNGGLFVIARGGSFVYSDCQYCLMVGASATWELCDWDGTYLSDVDTYMLAFIARYQADGGTQDTNYTRLFVMNNQPLFISRIKYGSTSDYRLSAVNLLNGNIYLSSKYNVGSTGIWSNEGHDDTADDRYYFFVGNKKIRINPTSLGTSGTWSYTDAIPPLYRWDRPMSASTGLTQPEGDEYEPWYDGQVLRNGTWLRCFPGSFGTFGTFYQTAPKENHVYSAY